jgi:hypothetical protein
LMKATLPPAVFADHADVRLTDDGRFVIVVSGEEARRYELPAAGGSPARLTDEWKLPPAFSSRVAIAPDGTLLFARTETLSRTQYPVAGVPPEEDPRRVAVYRWTPGRKPVEVRRHADHPVHVFDIQAVPDGSVFVASGTSRRKPGGASVVAYRGADGEPLRRIPLPKAGLSAGAGVDPSGKLLVYGSTEDGEWLLDLPFTGEGAEPAPKNFSIALGRRYRFVYPDPGVPVAHFDSDRPFVNLEPDQPIGRIAPRFTPNGRWVIWGSDEGAVKVAELEAVRKSLRTAGFEW